jgi:hypothetical protein
MVKIRVHQVGKRFYHGISKEFQNMKSVSSQHFYNVHPPFGSHLSLQCYGPLMRPQSGTGRTISGTRKTTSGTGKTISGTRKTASGTGKTISGTGKTTSGTSR